MRNFRCVTSNVAPAPREELPDGQKQNCEGQDDEDDLMNIVLSRG
jgi:hypothetical protein